MPSPSDHPEQPSEYAPVGSTAKRVGAPRRNGPRTATAIRLPDALHQRLYAAATERDVSLNFLVTKAVEQFLDRLIPVDEMRWTRD